MSSIVMNTSIAVYRSATLGAVLGLGLLACSSAGATLYSASATGNLNLTGVTSAGPLAGLTMDGTGYQTTDPAAAAVDSATFDFVNDPLGIGVGFNTLAAASSSGSGEAAGDAISAVAIEIFNGSSNIVELALEFTYSLSVAAGMISAGDEAEALVDLFIDGFLSSGDHAVAETLTVNDSVGVSSDASGGTSSFVLSLEVDETAYIDYSINALGFSTPSAVPAPAVPVLMALGLGILGYRRARFC